MRMKNDLQTPPLTTFVFDFGGVLFDWDPYYLYRKYLGDDRFVVEQFLEEIGFKDWNLEQDRGRPFAEAVEELSARFPQHASLIEAYDRDYEATISGVIEPTVEILQQLYRKGYPLYALSNWSAEKFDLIRPKYPFLNWFSGIVISGEERLIKPDPRLFEIVLQRANRSAHDCVFIDDSPGNIRVAQRLGFQTILFQSPDQLNEELERRRYLNHEAQR